MRVLVTGGTGLVGKRLKYYHPNWMYMSSRRYDLRCPKATANMFEDTKPDAVLHLAARVGGIKDNAENPAAYYHDNVMINTNVVHQAHLHGVERLLAALSTCAYPDRVEKYPFTEDDFLKGPPAETNLSYGYSKRMLHIQCQAYRKQHGLNYSTFCPSNLYGRGDHYNTTSSHFVAALISKVAPLEDGDTLELWGSGLPLRQQLYVDDLCELIPMLIEKHNSDLPLIVAPDENLSINEMTTALITQLHKNVKVVYNSTLDGQFRKDGSNQKLKELIGNYNFTKFKDGIMRTYNSYRDEM